MKNYDVYGLEAEKVVEKYMNEYSGFEIHHNDPNCKLYNDNKIPGHLCIQATRSKYGDIEINLLKNILKMNVVRGTWISHKAVDNFRGHFYCLFPHGNISNPSEGRIILNSTLKNFWNKCKIQNKYTEFINDKAGFRYNKVKAYITLEELLILLSKITIMNIDFGSSEFYKILKKPFLENLKSRSV
ncbi:MAG: hypothetical protein ACOC3V_03075 [bacterium]